MSARVTASPDPAPWRTSAVLALMLVVPLGAIGGVAFAWGAGFPVDTTYLGLALVWPGVAVAASGVADVVGVGWWGLVFAAEWLWITLIVRGTLALRDLRSRHDRPDA